MSMLSGLRGSISPSGAPALAERRKGLGYSAKFLFHMTPELKASIERAATSEKVYMSDWIRRAIEMALEEKKP